MRSALRKLAQADKTRGMSSRIVYLDRPLTGIAAVTDSADATATKAAVDAIASRMTPAYVVILGGPDVVAQPRLASPVHDDDQNVPSDLPYACDVALSTNPGAFVGPTRVVGRIPTLVGGGDPGPLVGMLERAAAWVAAPAGDMLPPFAATAEVWQGSTRQSVQHLSGAGATIHVSPPEGPDWPPATFGARLHFVNCHGADTDPHWYGQHGASYPVAFDSARLAGAVTAGTVVAAECCYGTQHYAPASAGGLPCIGMRYLLEGAWGVFGSSTEAYGPANTMGSADLLCRYFLTSVLEGASLGRAALEARLRFVHEAGELDPVDLKTLAQFDLLGDPSIQPVVGAAAVPVTATGSAAAAPSFSRGAATVRRQALAAMGMAVADTVPRPRPRPAARPGLDRDTVANLAGIAPERLGPVRTYAADRRPPGAPSVRYHVASEPVGAGRRVVVVRDSGGDLTTRYRAEPVNDPGSGSADVPTGRDAGEHIGTAERRPVGGRSKK